MRAGVKSGGGTCPSLVADIITELWCDCVQAVVGFEGGLLRARVDLQQRRLEVEVMSPDTTVSDRLAAAVQRRVHALCGGLAPADVERLIGSVPNAA